ncbi:MAG: c-type cytochrome [Akkermansiaceae bacterium]
MKWLSLTLGSCLSLQAQVISQFQSAGITDIRVDRIPALLLQPGDAPTAFLSPGPFETTWTGKLKIAKRQRLIFSFEGMGEAKLSIDGKELLTEQGKLGTARSEQSRINPGEHEIVITYKSQPDGAAHFRLFWEEKDFPRQSVPPTAFVSEITDATRLLQQQRRGRELFATQHCAKCHQSESPLGTDPMSELQEIAPLLVNPGDRLQENWLRAWLSEPHTLRPGTTMPQLFDPKKPESAQQIADLAAFLVSMKSGTPTSPEPAEEAMILAGGAHFHKLGCAACHTGPEQEKPDLENKRIPLHHVAAKFQPGALAAFLKAPNAYAPHRGMPDFKLSDEEVRNLSAFLSAKSKTPLPALPTLKGDAERGKSVASSHHCFYCHAGLPTPEKLTVPSLQKIFAANWNSKGCVAPNEKRGVAPALQLSEDDRLALIAFQTRGSSSLANNDKSEAAERKFHSLRCDACHARDEVPALLDRTHNETQSLTAHIAGANEKLDQSRPHMTFVGEMLQTNFTQSIIAGALDYKPRPWLDMRMPAYSAHAASISDGFARLHGIDPTEKNAHTSDPALVAAGKDLVSADKGFGCTTCHGLGNVKPTAAFEVQGLYFEQAANRLRREWYDRWMDNPGSVTPGTKMPQYAPGGQSPNPALNGNAAEQFNAIWHYLQSVKKN